MANIWLNRQFVSPYEGFDDEFLLRLVSINTYRADRELGHRSIPFLFWTSEIYSFGRCFREWLNWPWYLPLPFYSDHGVSFTGHLAPHEIENRSKYHLTWELDRYQAIRSQENKKVIRVPHPWILHRRKKSYEIRSSAKGTLVFYSHSIVGVDEVDYDFGRYLDKLRALPSSFQPIVFCMHMHDINKGLHKRLRNFGFPIVTAGNTSSKYFVDRFYDIATQFKYATSNTGGSEAYYCTELGMKYFIMGDPPVFYNHSHAQNKKGIQKPKDKIAAESLDKKNFYFRKFPPPESCQVYPYVEKTLGLDVDEMHAKKIVKSFLKREFFRLLPHYIFKLVFSSVADSTLKCITLPR